MAARSKERVPGWLPTPDCTHMVSNSQSFCKTVPVRMAFPHTDSGRTRGNSFTLEKALVRWDAGEELFLVRVGRPQHWLFTEALAAPRSLEVSKGRLDRAWSHLE